MYDNRKYVELNENGIVKRIHDIQAELILEGLQSRGLTKSLDAMKTLLENDIPKLRIEIKKRNKLVGILNYILIFLGALLLLYIFIPNRLNFELLGNLENKVGFIDSTMSIIVGLIVSFISISLWAKQRSQNSVRSITDDIHQLVHRIDMYQLGKKHSQILGKKPDQIIEGSKAIDNKKLSTYINSIYVAMQICGKMAALVYHNSDDDSITQSARHLEVISHQKSSHIFEFWKNYLIILK